MTLTDPALTIVIVSCVLFDVLILIILYQTVINPHWRALKRWWNS